MSVNFSVNNNSSASNVLQNMYYVQNQINTSFQQLSSGNQINSAADNPAGYAISQAMQQNVNGLNAAVQNAQNGISMIQTATGGMQQVGNILQTMNTLAVEASNGTQNSADLQNLQLEWKQLSAQINNIANQTQFNNIYLFTSSSSEMTALNGISLQIGANYSQVITFSTQNISATSLGVSSPNGTIAISTQALAEAAISAVASAISTLSNWEAQLGAVQDELNYTISNLQNTATNLQNANATITNTNMAQAYTTFTQQQVLSQVGTAMLSQAQQQPASILKLLS